MLEPDFLAFLLRKKIEELSNEAFSITTIKRLNVLEIFWVNIFYTVTSVYLATLVLVRADERRDSII